MTGADPIRCYYALPRGTLCPEPVWHDRWHAAEREWRRHGARLCGVTHTYGEVCGRAQRYAALAGPAPTGENR